MAAKHIYEYYSITFKSRDTSFFVFFFRNFLIRIKYCIILVYLCLHLCMLKLGQYIKCLSICKEIFDTLCKKWLDNNNQTYPKFHHNKHISDNN